MICVAVLQNCMGFVEDETGSNSEECVTYDVDGTEEVSINFEAIDIKEEVGFKVEEAIDIKDEIPEATSFPPMKTEQEVAIDIIKDEIREAILFPPIKTEQEVRLWGVCEVVAAHAFRASALEWFFATAVKQLQQLIIFWLCARMA